MKTIEKIPPLNKSEYINKISELKKEMNALQMVVDAIEIEETLATAEGQNILGLWNCVFRKDEYPDYDSITSEFCGKLRYLVKRDYYYFRDFHKRTCGLCVLDVKSILKRLDQMPEMWDSHELQVLRKRMERFQLKQHKKYVTI